MHEDDDMEIALRNARSSGNTDRVRQLEQQRANRSQEKEKLKLDLLKQQLDAGKNPPDDRTMVTMTHEQEEKANVITAQDRPTPEQQIQNAARKEKAKEESQEYQQDAG